MTSGPAFVLVLCAAATAAQEEPPTGLRGLSQEPPSALSFAALEDVSAGGFAFVELAGARDTFLVGEPFTLVLRLGFEAEFLRQNTLQLFQRELGVPVQLAAPWLESLPGAEAQDELAGEDGVTLALGERVVSARRAPDRTLDGKGFRVFELARRYVATRPGALALEAPVARFVYATRFEDDFLTGRVALDRRDVIVRGAPSTITILALPEEGRPPEFDGAIGSFALRAEAEPRELAAGEELALTVRVEGPGDLSQSDGPELDDLAGFHVRGRLVEREPGRLTVRYDLAPDGPEVREVPAIRFAFYDTAPPAGYRTLASEPIALRVHPRAAPPAGTEPAASAQAPSGSDSRFPLLALGAGLAAILALAGIWIARRARR